ncbi:MAG TPA: NAD(P)-dependent oxidoreductase [Gammaproteobacteria bacterium]|jgi:3-hydroxyisobutyrate dehydrogenase
MLKAGFVGLGNMGWPMAANLARAGHALLVRDLDTERQRRFAAEHSAAVADVPAAFADVDVIITMLPTGSIVREVLFEWSGGIARALKRGAVVIDMSSSEPAGTRNMGAELKQLGIVLIDAPVSGGVPRATTGTLSIMIGADDAEAAARVRPVLEKLGQKFFATGSLGTGHAMKALNNFVAAAGYTAAAEALIAGRGFGLDPAVMVEILNASTGRNFSTEYAMKEHVLSGKFATGFALGLLAKDIGIAADLAVDVGVDAPLSRLLKKRWAEAVAKGGPAVDHSAAILYWEDPAGGR